MGSIRTRLLALALAAGIAVLLVSGYALVQMRSLAGTLGDSIAQAQAATVLVQSVDGANLAFKSQVQEWKNILLRGNDKEMFDKYLAQFEAEERKVDEALRLAAKSLQTVGMEPRLAEKAIAEHGPLGAKYREALKSFDPADPEAGKKVDRQVKGMDRALSAALSELSASVEKSSAERASLQLSESKLALSRATLWTLGGMFVGVSVLLAICWRLALSILRPVQDLQQTMSRVERDWDLSCRVAIQGRDEIALCAQAFNSMLERFREIIREIRGESDELAGETREVSQSADRLSEGASELGDSTSTVAAAVEELSVSMGQVREAGEQASHSARASSERASSGGAAISATAAQMKVISLRVTESAAAFQQLGARSEAISGIVDTVSEIADQTSLLALNAAIEAARAGEQGRGFAVVADEVRKLAEKTTQATGQISALVRQMQSGTGEAVQGIQAVVSDVEAQVGQTEEALQKMAEIEELAQQCADAVGRIHDALGEQSAASHLIARQVEQIAQMGEANQGSAGSIATSTVALKELAERLAGSANRFKT
ncbi:methyl-accepting chemotaxis protein [Niveibacterium terrae]|uniref:methyl-accepting chemotaxis protein n=1 Tax=Niveibacterium terrae TaxID=3373598 RepID=UPI003A8D557E